MHVHLMQRYQTPQCAPTTIEWSNFQSRLQQHMLCLYNSKITFELGKDAFWPSQMMGQGQSGGAAEKTECFSKGFKTTSKLQG